MDLGQLFWIVIVVMALQPVLARRMLELRRMSMIDKLQKARGSRVILLVHRQEAMKFFGIPLMRYIDVHDSEEVLRAIRMTDDDVPLDIVLHTPGGLVLAALQIARAVEAHPGKVTVFVPYHAMSGGTLIALAGDEIVMSPHAVLGPVDPQVGQYPAASILDVVATKTAAEVDDETLILADVSRKAIAQVRRSVRGLLARHMAPDRADGLAHLLASGAWTHDYPISADEARDLGLPVSTDLPEDVLTLLTLYPQPVRQTGGVEYLPTPRRMPPKP